MTDYQSLQTAYDHIRANTPGLCITDINLKVLLTRLVHSTDVLELTVRLVDCGSLTADSSFRRLNNRGDFVAATVYSLIGRPSPELTALHEAGMLC